MENNIVIVERVANHTMKVLHMEVETALTKMEEIMPLFQVLVEAVDGILVKVVMVAMLVILQLVQEVPIFRLIIKWVIPQVMAALQLHAVHVHHKLVNEAEMDLYP